MSKLAMSVIVGFACLVATAAIAGSGVIEFNQACISVGCFDGDDPGFPVTIQSPGSYRLTSRLEVTSSAADAISISAASGVTLDLGGFRVQGPTSCTGEPTSPSNCTPEPFNSGIRISGADAIVRNGQVSGFRFGISCRVSCEVDNLTITDSYFDGINIAPTTEARSLVLTGSRLIQNGDDGVQANGRHHIIRDSTFWANGGTGIMLGSSAGVVQGNSVRDNGATSHFGSALVKGNYLYQSSLNAAAFSVNDNNCNGTAC